jgi:hypothetical protein
MTTTPSSGTKWLIGALVVATILLNWIPQLDVLTQKYLETSISDNLVIYATARVVNGVISVIQSIELSLSLGAGVAMHLGEVLDPLNDLIERFSAFVLYGLTALGIQQLVLLASSSTIMKLLTSIMLIAGYIAWLQQRCTWLANLALVLIVVRFAFVVEVGVSYSLDRLYFSEHQQQAHSTLELARDKLASIKDEYMASSSGSGIFGGVWETAQELLGDGNHHGVTDLAADAIVQLIVIMLIRSIVLPVVFLILVFYASKQLLHTRL